MLAGTCEFWLRAPLMKVPEIIPVIHYCWVLTAALASSQTLLEAQSRSTPCDPVWKAATHTWAGKAGTVLGAPVWGARSGHSFECWQESGLRWSRCSRPQAIQKLMAMVSEDQLFRESSAGKGLVGGWGWVQVSSLDTPPPILNSNNINSDSFLFFFLSFFPLLIFF